MMPDIRYGRLTAVVTKYEFATDVELKRFVRAVNQRQDTSRLLRSPSLEQWAHCDIFRKLSCMIAGRLLECQIGGHSYQEHGQLLGNRVVVLITLLRIHTGRRGG